MISQELARKFIPKEQNFNTTFFLTFRLHLALPMSIEREIKRNFLNQIHQIDLSSKSRQTKSYYRSLCKKRMIVRYDQLMRNREVGPHFLADERVAQICMEQFHKYDNEFYKLIAFTIMGNHVHLLVKVMDTDDPPYDSQHPYLLKEMINELKLDISRKANLVLGRKGQFWTREVFELEVKDHQMLRNIIRYTLNEALEKKDSLRPQDRSFAYLNENYDHLMAI